MQIDVEMLAFMDGQVRTVEVPDDEWQQACKLDAEMRTGMPTAALEQVYYYGQNEVQNVPGRCSVSVGDVANVDGHFFRVNHVGFSHMGLPELARYVALPQRDRVWDGVYNGHFFEIKVN